MEKDFIEFENIHKGDIFTICMRNPLTNEELNKIGTGVVIVKTEEEVKLLIVGIICPGCWRFNKDNYLDYIMDYYQPNEHEKSVISEIENEYEKYKSELKIFEIDDFDAVYKAGLVMWGEKDKFEFDHIDI